MSLRCYYAAPDPSYYYSHYYQDEMPPWYRDESPRVREEPVRSYQEYIDYLRSTYLIKSSLAPNQLFRPSRQSITPTVAPVTARPKPVARPIIRLSAWIEGVDVARGHAIRAGYRLSRLVEWVTINGVAGLEDLIDRLYYALDLIQQKIDYDNSKSKRRKGKKKIKRDPNHPKLTML